MSRVSPSISIIRFQPNRRRKASFLCWIFPFYRLNLRARCGGKWAQWPNQRTSESQIEPGAKILEPYHLWRSEVRWNLLVKTFVNFLTPIWLLEPHNQWHEKNSFRLFNKKLTKIYLLLLPLSVEETIIIYIRC